MMENEQKVANIQLEQKEGYFFNVSMDYPEGWTLSMDEPEPLGKGQAPNAVRMLAAAVGHCLSSSLWFCLQKSQVSATGITSNVQALIKRNEKKRWRVASINVTILVRGISPQDYNGFQRCLSIFEDYCIVTASIRQGIPVSVEVVKQE